MTTIMSEKEFFNRFAYNPEKDLLGSGGFGSVYRAYDAFEKRYVAIKISQVKDVYGKFTLLNEVELSKSIDDHTNVARYELGLRVKTPFPVDYAIMAYYEDGNLDSVLRKQKDLLSEQDQYDIIEGLLEGIAHLHSENVIHRDLKLANILMHRTKQGQWRTKIADFGLSKQIDAYDSSIANSAIGITIAYAAPEQIENKPIRRNVDLWAFGVIVYRMLTGEMPFEAVSGRDSTSAVGEISRKITEMQLPQKLNSLPEPYQTMIRRCWVKDTTLRAQSASELLALLPEKYKRAKQNRQASFSSPLLFNNDVTNVLIDSHSSDSSEKDAYEATLIETDRPSKKIGTERKSKTLIYASICAAVFLVGSSLFFMFSKEDTTKLSSNIGASNVKEQEETAFKHAVQTQTIATYTSFLNEFAHGKYHLAAKDSLTTLEKKYTNLLNDADIFISDKDYVSAKEYLNNALK
jgi:serine/threonine protein kinase